MKINKFIFLTFTAFGCLSVSSTELDPMVDYRYDGKVIRSENGETLRSSKVISGFKLLYACPSTKKRYGVCPGWAIDHVIPLSCGGVDAIYNMQWLPNEIKNSSGIFSKDRFERRVYGGNKISKGCP